jgi:subtilisin family serine protease
LRIADLHARGLDGDGVAVAVVDTGISINAMRASLGYVPRFDVANSWSSPNITTMPGQFEVDHGTMCAYDVLIAAPRATLLDFPALATPAPFSVTLGIALMAFSQILAAWIVAPAAGGANRYKALVVSNSWGMYDESWDFPAGHPGRYCDNPNHPFQTIVSALVRGGVDIVFAAGNCGNPDPDIRCGGHAVPIMGASAYPDVLTVAGCDVTDRRVRYSSQGPSIAGMYQQKPDLTAYTEFLGSRAFGPQEPDIGTSAACPIAAGCIAALRTNTAICGPQALSPANLIAQLRGTARQVGGARGWNQDYGHGIIDPIAAAQSIGVV